MKLYGSFTRKSDFALGLFIIKKKNNFIMKMDKLNSKSTPEIGRVYGPLSVRVIDI
jgi:hypothetical protein